MRSPYVRILIIIAVAMALWLPGGILSRCDQIDRGWISIAAIVAVACLNLAFPVKWRS
ncbi:hypothetical protein [Haloferula sp. BvORR071]|uniref:hypothetical protein n=1 Tax=Haloferula sp. BvORR071 TaxID=1396141 RepID=UPI002240EBFC|nr:hypothetical protein [Haloferula sp. BvORR071]